MIQGKLPLPWTEFFGRERERVSLKRLLLRARLVTVVGLSGVGKTRLARQVAEDLLPQFGGQVWFVPCEELESAAAIPPMVRKASGRDGSPPTDSQHLLPTLSGHRALLFLDTAECLLAHGLGEFLVGWLERLPELTVLLTSLAPTDLAGEHLLTLRPMLPSWSAVGVDATADPALPEALGGRASESWFEADALRLFEARAQQRDCDWELTAANVSTVVELCRAADWLPIGIELAAGQLAPWSESQLLAQIRRRGHLLDLEAPARAERHTSLRRAVGWSWSILPAAERRLTALLASCGGQLFEEALEPLTTDPAAPSLARSLYRKGILQAEERAGRLRYRLPETVRRFALEQEPTAEENLSLAAPFSLDLAHREGERLGTPQAAAAAEALRLEAPMLRRCWAWAREQENPRLLCGFASALWGPLLHELELLPEAHELAEAALAHTGEPGEDSQRLLWIAATVAARFGPSAEAAARLHSCLDAGTSPLVRALALRELGQLQLLQGQPLSACDSLQQSVSALHWLGREAEEAWTRRILAEASERLGDREGAQRLLEEVRLQFIEMELPTGQASACVHLARMAADEGHWEMAEARGQEAARHYHLLGQAAGSGTALLQIARVRASQGEWDEAQRLYSEALCRLRSAGIAVPLCHALLQLAAEPHPRARPLDPTRAYRECIVLARERGLRSLLAHALRGLADLYAAGGRTERALSLADEAVQVARETTETPLIQSCLDLYSRFQISPERPRPGVASPPRAKVPYTVQVESVSVKTQALPQSVGPEPARHPGRTPDPRPLAAASGAESEYGQVRVRLLGGMRLFVDEEEVPLLDWWAKAKKLFAYLVIHRGRPISRDILLEEFWPDGDQQRAIHSLQTTLSFLRRSLRALPGGQRLADRLIVSRDGNYLFDSEGRCESDLQQFDVHLQEALRLKANGQLDEAAVHWTAADQLYSGDLLPEFPYEDWCASPRERLRSHYLELLLSLALYHRQAQRPGDALRTAERMFVIDSCDERAHRMAMRCHVQMGRPVDALRQFERCCQVLERELRVQPSKATRELHDLIRQRMDGPRPPAAESQDEAISATTP